MAVIECQNKCIRTSPFLLSLIALVFYSNAASAQPKVVEASLRARVINEAPSVLSSYEATASTLEESSVVDVQSRFADEFESLAEQRWNCRYCNKYRMREVEIIPKHTRARHRHTLNCDNDQYSFCLRKPEGKTEFLVDETHTYPDEPFVGDSPVFGAQFAYASLQLLVRAAKAESGYTLIGLSWLAPDSVLSATMRRKLHFSPPGGRAVEVDEQIEATFDVAAGWRVLQEKVVTAQYSLVREMEYGWVADGLHFPKQVIATDIVRAGKGVPLSKSNIRVTSLGKCKRPPTDFYLTHYGLPEPPGITAPARPTPNYVWLLIAAAVLGVIAVGCRWLLKRKAKVVPPPVPPTPTA